MVVGNIFQKNEKEKFLLVSGSGIVVGTGVPTNISLHWKDQQKHSTVENLV